MKKFFIFVMSAVLLMTTGMVTTDCSSDTDNPVISPDQDIPEERIFNENKTFTVDNGFGTIVYQSRIGKDFDSALDSFIREREPLLNTLKTEGHYSGEGLYLFYKKKINVDFSYDNREFILLIISDKANIYQVLFTCEVIDEKGNYYRLVLPENGDDRVWE